MNHNINYLQFCCRNQNIYLFKDFKGIAKKTKILLKSFVHNKEGIDLLLIVYNNKNFESEPISLHLDWDEEIPFTHFKTAEEAYKHARFTKIPLGVGLEDFIFDKSPKYATEYAISINKRTSAYLESKIFRNYRYLFYYSKHFDLTLTENQEKVFLKDKTANYVANYGIQKIKGKLPEMLHNYLLMTVASQKNKEYYPSRYLELYGNHERNES